ncbi:hypothetical protein EV361DRAFT_949176 [Lentinula raphanica]|nr:hypothetical protein EV361DRAFT_949176 [Lentinula raphanica]
MPYNCVPSCSAGPWSVKRAATLHRNSCPKWNDYYASKRKLDSDSSSSDSSDTPSVRPRINIAARKASERRRKKARLQATNAGGNSSSTTSVNTSAQAGPSNVHRDPEKTHRTTEGVGGSSDINIDENFDSIGFDITSIAPIISSEGSELRFGDSLAGAGPSAAPSPAAVQASPHATEDTNVPETVTGSGRPQRNRRLPARYRDFLPEGTSAIVNPAPSDEEDSPEPEVPLPRIRRLTLTLRERLKTCINSFQLWREYPHKPSYDPDGEVGIEDLSNLPTQRIPDDDESSSDSESASPLNPTQTLLTAWQNNGNATKSHGEMNKLAHLIQRPDFQVSELQGYSAQAANAKLTKADEDWDHNKLKDSFKETSIDIEVPSGDKNIPSKTFSIPGLLYRSPLSVIRAAFTGPLAKHFHYTPFRLFQKLPSSNDSQDEPEFQRVYTDLYNSDAFLREHYRVQRAPTDDPECKAEKVVAALMCWSDATQLANFGTAKLWPVYMLFGNLSKYIRSSPNSGAVNHLAYIPVIPDSIKHDITTFHAKRKADILTHCNRELYHAVWRHLLDDEFVHAYRYGVIIEGSDGIKRRIYPRFFTYSADYPEKVLLATIRDLGNCPCPRCLCPKASLDQMGTRRDLALRKNTARTFLIDRVKKAREYIYRKGFGIRSARVEELLKATSSVPTMNAFVDRLGSDFNPSHMLAPDFMHEFELGVFKSLFAHLIRVLHAKDSSLVSELDHRQVAISDKELEKLICRDQCSIPVFDGLLKDSTDNEILINLLYRAAEWHALAKLRLHTDRTLDYLETRTQEFGKLMREFRDVSKKFNTKETDREKGARYRRTAEQAKKTNASTSASAIGSGSARPKTLNLNTYKWHGMADDVPFIRHFGPTDSYSTQLGELAHRVVKKLYSLGNKKNDPVQIGRRLRRVEWSKHALDQRGIHTERRRQQVVSNTGDNVTSHYHVGKTNKKKTDIRTYTTSGDPAAKDFWPKLQDHLLGRLMERDFDGDTHDTFTDEDRQHIHIRDRKVVELQTLRVNYTTYDVRRDQDTINPHSHADVMVLSPETGPDAHPYWYARVLRIFRVWVVSNHPAASTARSGPQEMIVLWARWLGIDPEHHSGHQSARLPKIGFVDESDPFAFGFLDPAHIIRGCHLLPAFSDKRTNGLLQTTEPTIARRPGETDDWQFFYVGIFVDRDMYMRYFPGGGVGHLTHTEFFRNEVEQYNTGGESGDEEDELELGSPQPAKMVPAHLDSEILESGSEDQSSLSEEDEEDDNKEDNEDDEDVPEEDEEEESEDLDGGIDEDNWEWDDGYGSL